MTDLEGKAPTASVERATRRPPVSQPHRVRWRWMLAAGVVVAAVLVAALSGGWDVQAWLRAVWHSLGSVSPGYIVAALALQTMHVGFSAAAWHAILRYAYPEDGVRYLAVFASYTSGVALNAVTPANAGTLVTVLMFVAIISRATPASVAAAAAVEKLFFAVVGVLVVAYMFVSVGGSFDRKFGFVTKHPWMTALVIGVGVLVAIVAGRLTWRWLRRLWEQAKQGGKILSDRRAYVRLVVIPQLLSWCCKAAVIAVLLAGYGIPVGFQTVFSVAAGNSLANIASVTPGSIGVSQVFNVASLNEVTDAATAGAYSVGQQLLTTVWNIALAAVLVAFVFGRSKGRQLIEQSYAGARELREQSGAPGGGAGADG